MRRGMRDGKGDLRNEIHLYSFPTADLLSMYRSKLSYRPMWGVVCLFAVTIRLFICHRGAFLAPSFLFLSLTAKEGGVIFATSFHSS